MKSYATIILIVLLIEIGTLLTVMLYKNEMKQVIVGNMKEGLNQYEFDGANISNEKRFAGLTAIWNAVQQEYECCGVEGPNDWKYTTWGKTFPNMLPNSCCKTSFNRNECWNLSDGRQRNNVFTKGCLEEVVDYARNNIEII